MHPSTSRPSLRRTAPRILGATALFGAMLTGASATAAPDAEELAHACVGDDGVTVVVDFTDLGGEVEVACAEGEPEDGRDALELAGFTPEDSMPGMICAIDANPDPCPEEFDGSYWSYWFGDPDGEWETYMVGADEAEPAPGDFEGWRYFDGTEGPHITPAMISEASEEPAEDPEATDETSEDGNAATTDAEESSGISGGLIAAAGIAAALIILTVVLVRRRGTQMKN